jgi:hypothetical protein
MFNMLLATEAESGNMGGLIGIGENEDDVETEVYEGVFYCQYMYKMACK